MSGQPKRGLDYVGWNVRIFEDDTKIDELIDSQGWTGYVIYHYLFLKASASDGYFYRWSYKNAPSTARKMGGGISSESVKQTVSLCLRIGLFDNRLFDREGILTNKEIQTRYMLAIEKRSAVGRTIRPEYWLLSRDETKGYIIIPENTRSLPENSENLPENAAKESKVKESKVNKSKVNESMCGALPCRNGEFCIDTGLYTELTHTYPNMNIDLSIERLRNYLTANPHKQGTPKSTEGYLKIWLSEDDEHGRYRKSKPEAKPKNTYEPTYDIAEYESTSVTDCFDTDDPDSFEF